MPAGVRRRAGVLAAIVARPAAEEIAGWRARRFGSTKAWRLQRNANREWMF
jgi:hypothetical protein